MGSSFLAALKGQKKLILGTTINRLVDCRRGARNLMRRKSTTEFSRAKCDLFRMKTIARGVAIAERSNWPPRSVGHRQVAISSALSLRHNAAVFVAEACQDACSTTHDLFRCRVDRSVATEVRSGSEKLSVLPR
jgi:hypothetical protein